MKKLIVLSVVLALVATAAFAVDIGGEVFGKVVPASGESGDAASDDITSDLGFGRVRLSGYGEAGDGAFGGYIRVDGDSVSARYAFWKPIDQLKVLIGNNPDGFYGKEGVTGWMFNENPYDGGVAYGGDKVWGEGYYGWGIGTRSAFYGGYGGDALHLNITPVEMFTINVAIPFASGAKTEDVFKDIFIQADVNLDFGNIALSFQAKEDAGDVYLYYGGSFGDLGVDFGFHYDLAEDAPLGVGLGLKYATDAFGVKFRTVARLAGGDKATRLIADVLPYFPLGDNIVVFVNMGIAMVAPDEGDSIFDWSFNPYLRIGEEWGAQFLVGLQVYSKGGKDGITYWSIPIGIMVMF
jgi:hypothetical protein